MSAMMGMILGSKFVYGPTPVPVPTAGWYASGKFGSPAALPFTASVVRITFANDTVAASSAGSIPLARIYMAGTGNNTYGYYGGGNKSATPTLVSTITRLTYSNSTASDVTPFAAGIRGMGATGNQNYGWFGGGYQPGVPYSRSIVNRMDYSNDGTTPLTRGSLSIASTIFTASGSPSDGWWAGARNPGSITSSNSTRITYANDTATSVTKGPLFTSVYSAVSASDNATYVWFAGGSISTFAPYTNTSRVSRLTMANDTPQMLSRGPLTARGYSGATTNYTYGWFGGGYTYPSTYTASVWRITYANDTVVATVSGIGTLGTSRVYHAASSGLQ